MSRSGCCSPESHYWEGHGHQPQPFLGSVLSFLVGMSFSIQPMFFSSLNPITQGELFQGTWHPYSFGMSLVHSEIFVLRVRKNFEPHLMNIHNLPVKLIANLKSFE